MKGIISSYNDINIDYKDIDILLTKDDFINNNEIEISPHIVKGSYKSYKNYLNTMFYLEYEDCYKKLKEEIYELQKNKKSINLMDEKELQYLNKYFSDLYFYLDGKIRYINIDRNGVILTMDFCSSNKKKLNSKNMKYGSLIILSDNKFQNYVLTTVFYNSIKPLKFPYYRINLSLLDINKENILF